MRQKSVYLTVEMMEWLKDNPDFNLSGATRKMLAEKMKK